MAPKGGQKKKKAAASVNRGFSTVSVPRKKDLEELEEIKEVEKAKELVADQVTPGKFY